MTETPLAIYLSSGLTQAGLAKLVGCHQTEISRLLRNRRSAFVIKHADGTLALRVEKIVGAKKRALEN